MGALCGSAPWGPPPSQTRGFFSSRYGGDTGGASATITLNNGGSPTATSSSTAATTAESVGRAITAALGFGGAPNSSGGAGDADRGPSSWAARMRYRRQEPTFNVIECYPNGVAREGGAPRTARELGLHPRDVGLFAPLSRLGAPQRATIAVR